MVEQIDRQIDSALNAIRASDARGATRAVGYLAAEDPEAVVEALGIRVLDMWEQRGRRPLGAAPFLPDPAVGDRLIAALEARQIAQVVEAVGGTYPKLLAKMVLTLAALDREKPTAGHTVS